MANQRNKRNSKNQPKIASIFKPKKNTHPTKKRASIQNIYRNTGSATPPATISHQQLSIPDDLNRSTSTGIPLPLINEREDESYNFGGLDKYKLKYYTPGSIYERLLSDCNCKLCKKK
eukprot:871313_1